MPILFLTAVILLNISASSAFIERFFSICGVVCENHREKQLDDMIACRCLLKANMQILLKLKETGAFDKK
jgi:hypothetical protein